MNIILYASYDSIILKWENMLLSWAKGTADHHRKCKKIKEMSTSETTVNFKKKVPWIKKTQSKKTKKPKDYCAYGLNNKQQKKKSRIFLIIKEKAQSI